MDRLRETGVAPTKWPDLGPSDRQKKAKLDMYTQCPECGTAFRVTAEVLKQAAGKVRCGGCAIAFNALDYLSEQKPAAAPAPATDSAVPELTPDSPELEPVEPPKTISAEQSAALLKTLDELAGSDIRIEDTGVEWRVLDEDEEEIADELKDIDVAKELEDTGSMKWFIDETPTPVDEHLSAEPGEMDAPELFEGPAHVAGGDEMRFDDDTPLPDDFDFDQEPSAEPAPVPESRDAPADLEAAQVDLALGDPEDWEDLLGEVDEEDFHEDTDEDLGADILDAHFIGEVRILVLAKSAELAEIGADIRIVDMLVIDEKRIVAVFSFPNNVCQISDGEEIRALVQADAILHG